jgi:hypothetical protein
MNNNATETKTVSKNFGLSSVCGRPLALALGLMALLSLQPSSFGQSPTHWSSSAQTYTTPYGSSTNPYGSSTTPYGSSTNPYGSSTNPYGSAQQSVHVQGYVRQDGGYVAPHNRSAPDGSTLNNWSTLGNVNIYTGKVGTRR